jgi:hypothetical protein
MHQRTILRGAVLLLAFGAGVAQAQTSSTAAPASAAVGSQQWTVDSGQTVGAGSDVLRGQIGWPGLWADYIHGIDPTFDIGGRFGINWGGFDGATYGGQGFGLSFQLLLRKQFFDIGSYHTAFTFDPGIILAFSNYTTNGTAFGIAFPIGWQIGFPVADKWVINASLDLPMYVLFGTFGSLYIPILIGGGVEYQFQPNLSFTAKLRLGVTIGTGSVGAGPFSTTVGTSFTPQALVGVAYKFN